MDWKRLGRKLKNDPGLLMRRFCFARRKQKLCREPCAPLQKWRRQRGFAPLCRRMRGSLLRGFFGGRKIAGDVRSGLLPYAEPSRLRSHLWRFPPPGCSLRGMSLRHCNS